MSDNFTSGQDNSARETKKTTIWMCTTAALFLMIIAIVFGNTLVLFTTWFDKRLHQPNKYFIACLAVADLFVGIFSVPIRLYLHFHYTDLMKVELCKFWNWIDISCETASILTLTIVSVDRYFKINMNFRYRSLMVTSRFLVFICFIWLISCVFATLGLFSYNSLGIYAKVGQGCLNDNYIYITIAAVAFFFLPLLVIILMYTSIFYTAHQRKRRARNGALGHSFALGRKRTFAREFLQELKTVRMLLLVVVTFMICWGPFFTVYLLNIYRSNYVYKSLTVKEWQIFATIFVIILPSFNSSCNPVIYACFDREYGKAFKSLFHRIIFRDRRPAADFRKSSSSQSFWLKELQSRRTSNLQHGASGIQDNSLAEAVANRVINVSDLGYLGTYRKNSQNVL